VVFQDVFPEAGVISGFLTNRLVVRVLRRVQRILVRRADHVVTIADAMRDRLVDRGADAERVTVIPNWADLEQVTPEPRVNGWAQDHHLADGFTVMHSGNVGLLHSLETLITAARQIVGAKFVIVGDGAAKPRVVECARQQGAANVRFLPYQPRSLLRYSLASADVHVVSLMPGVAGFVEAAKIYGVLAAGRPVIAAVDEWSEAARLVREGQCGMVVPPGDAQELAAAVQRMAELPAREREQLGHRAREIAEARCGREQATQAYRRLIATLTSEASRQRSRGNARLVAPL
jgi:glycosyltransferase involved in cell wall biosynthesis